MAHWRYLKYVVRHRWFVALAGQYVFVPFHQIVLHDWTKFLPSEWFPYVDSFYRKDRKDPVVRARFDRAWLLHQRRSPHHWQFWVLTNDTDGTYPLEMPERYAREMVADWAGAGRAITGKWDLSIWYEKHRDKIVLHENTRSFVDRMVESLRNQLEEPIE